MKHLSVFVLSVGISLSSLAQQDSSVTQPDTSRVQQDSTTVMQQDLNVKQNETVNTPTRSETSTNDARRNVYKIKPAIDVPVTVIGGGWTLYAFSQIYNRDRSTAAQINALNSADINGFDRWAVDVFSQKAASTSDLFLYGAMPLPMLLLFDKSIRSDAGKIGLLYLEAMAVTGTLYSTAAITVNRYRPYAYNPEAPMSLRQGGGAKNSFFAGHVALVGTSTFFIAKVFSDYHPDSRLRPYLWTAAAVATGMAGYLRHRGGRHFPSDILTGAAVGALSGIFIPQFHKLKLTKNQNLTLLPYVGSGSRGIAMLYRL